MPHLCIHLLGTFQVTLDDQPVDEFESDKVRALLAYLAVESDRPHRREALAGMLWPDSTEQAARTNLRHVLSNLRRSIGDQDATPPFLLIDHQTIQYNVESNYTLDVTRFLHLSSVVGDFDLLEEAVAIYRGPFMTGFSLADGVLFEEWALVMRERLVHQMLGALEKLVLHYDQTGAYDRALPHAWQQVEIDPLREEGYQQLMRLLTLSDQRSLALVIYESCRRNLAEELAAEPSPETEELVERIRNGALNRGAAKLARRRAARQGSGGVTEAAIPQHNLPIQLTAFVGKETELGKITERLADPACRLLTLVGPGGSGKTRLAIQAAQMLLEAAQDHASDLKMPMTNVPLAHGVWYAPLGAIDAPSQLVSSIAEALNVSFHNGDNPKTQLLDFLREKHLLLILDNFEHLLAEATLLTKILITAPYVKILVTSREVLALHEEWLISVEGMTFPSSRQHYDFDVFEAYEAVKLFDQCARQVQVGFDLTAEQSNVALICQLVEGLPLGIELAAAWLRLLPCAQIARSLRQGLDLLTTSHRDIPDRHRSIRAVFEHSWQLLSDDEQSALRQMSVFRGNFRAEAAKQITGASLPMLARLVEKSLLHPVSDGRYHMHELLRQYAIEKLAADPDEETATQHRHSTYYLAYVSHREPALNGHRQRQALAEIGEASENISVAWYWALDQGCVSEIERAIYSLHEFYTTRSRYTEGRDLFKAAASCLNHEVVLGKVLARYGAFCSALGELDQAKDLLERSLALVEKQPDRAETAFVLFTLGGMVKIQGNLDEARQLCEQSLNLSLPAGHLRWAGIALDNLATIAQYLGDFSEAKRCHEESIAISRTDGHQADIAYSLNRLGMVAVMQGQYQEAEACFEESLTISEAIGDRFEMSMALGGFGWVDWGRSGAFLTPAKAWFEQSLAICREIGYRYHMTYRLGMLSRVTRGMEDYEAALRYGREALDIARQFTSPFGISFALNAIGSAMCAAGDFDGARRHLREALQVAIKAQAFPNLTEALTYIADLFMAECGATSHELRLHALEILTLVRHHSTSSYAVKQHADHLIAQLMPELSPDEVERAVERGRTVDLLVVVEELLSGAMS